MNIEIKTEDCLICGKKLNTQDRIKGHLIPKCLKSKHNVLAFFHRKCEERINSLYVSQQKRSLNKKFINNLEEAILKLTNLLDKAKENDG